jgi:hypothetical protein
MSQVEKKREKSADDIIKRSVELFGKTPEEISDNNERWMRKQGYKKPHPDEVEPRLRVQSPRPYRLKKLLEKLGLNKS